MHTETSDTHFTRRIKIVVEYDGTPYHGFQRQANLKTVQQCLENAAQVITKHPITIHAAGRTDVGVHAIGQVVHFDTSAHFCTYKLVACMNAHLREEKISVLSAEDVDFSFHARFSAQKRCYRYHILNRRSKPALNQNVWWIKESLDIDAMHNAAQYLLGTHDLSTFRGHGCQASSPIRTIHSMSFMRDSEHIVFEIAAKSFLYHQVRNIIGTLYKVGIGQWSLDDFLHAKQACDRKRGGITAPAAGLVFVSVTY